MCQTVQEVVYALFFFLPPGFLSLGMQHLDSLIQPVGGWAREGIKTRILESTSHKKVL